MGCVYFFSSKIQNYSPTEAAKVYDKPLQRKALLRFNPESVLNTLAQENMQTLDDDAREKLVDDYIQVMGLNFICAMLLGGGVGFVNVFPPKKYQPSSA